ncbi:DoxX family protein [Synechococcus sp. BMK-MC-1]|jgi:uncharacterized membrane protein YphA (DoxX/SURF4 family)|uniref:DoxX family protein n=1 Tax=Synechococcus sp. BMK-MC-1 TaxID=1442551 RepID=UPI00164768B7|nr:DoxX family protein [Synechococcus sp. BMK-MC-1]QNI67094.1 hypothetical protein SynBMKMC1_01010 [Synechococcus sp. BMK-MC-1]
MFNSLAPSKALDFLGRLGLAAVFVNALPSKFSGFAATVALIASKGIAEPLAGVLLVAAIVILIAGSLLLVFGTNTRLGASLLLVFLVPTTLIFHTFPVDASFFMNLALIGALVLAITRSTGAAVPNFRDVRVRDGMKALRR